MKDDLISRRAAIDWLSKEWNGMVWTVFDGIRALPSAQPEPIKIQIDHELTHDEFEKLRKDMADAPIVLMPSAQEHKIHFADADHVWIDGKQYISLGRFQKAVVEAQPERKKDVIQSFRDYQIEWLTSHCDIELEPELETWVVRFLCDTADCFDMEVEHK